MSETVFEYRHRVGYADCTLGNHVYYSRYLEILEHARNEYFRELGVSFQMWQERDVIFPVIECHLKYLAPARYDDVLVVQVRVVEARRARLNFSYRVATESGKLVAQAETYHFCTTVGEKPQRLPAELIAALGFRVASLAPAATLAR